MGSFWCPPKCGIHSDIWKGKLRRHSFFFVCHEGIVVENNEFWIMFSVDCLWSNGNLLKSTQQLKALKNGKKIIWLLDYLLISCAKCLLNLRAKLTISENKDIDYNKFLCTSYYFLIGASSILLKSLVPYLKINMYTSTKKVVIKC